MTNKKHKVFVYGTLRPHGVAATHKLVGYQMFDYFGRFPYIQAADRFGGVVYGNIIEVDNTELSQLDRIEGIDAGLYRRITEQVYRIDPLQAVTAFVYVAGNIAPPPIPSGDWTYR